MSETVAKKPKIEPQEHHKQLNTCGTRPPYRQGRKLTAVKVRIFTKHTWYSGIYFHKIIIKFRLIHIK